MISQIHIKNFKSIVDLTLDLGRVNLFIGENGCGKSNILEAVAFVESTNNNLVNNSILLSKGARINTSAMFANAFNVFNSNIEIDILIDDFLLKNEFAFENDRDWINISRVNNFHIFQSFVTNVILTDPKSATHFWKAVDNAKEKPGGIREFEFNYEKLTKHLPEKIKKQVRSELKLSNEYSFYTHDEFLTNYMIYTPELSYLRKFEEEGQVSPLGARGEGLFSLLKSLSKENGSLQHIKECMEAIDWFEDFEIPGDLMSNEYRLSIKDKYINSDLKYFDQRSANEGFLFLLFYIVLFSSKRTPQFFAIDNIEASFNPKLCSKLISMLVSLAKQNNKQVLMTTHNPATLDGLDLKDPDQRLFVVRRNIEGHTIATRILEKPQMDSPMKLSEMWMKGFLGGLPENF